MNTLKVHKFWNKKSCGEDLFLPHDDMQGYEFQAKQRYLLEPYIIEFANFKNSNDKTILEVGVGLGADHQKFAENRSNLYGIDLTERAINHTKKRLDLFNLNSNLSIQNAEELSFEDESFDLVYSWGVIHHAENPEKVINEIHRVLKENGDLKIMLYNKLSIVIFLLWIRYALLKFKPWKSLDSIVSQNLESPGTKSYTKKQAYKLLKNFKKINIDIQLSHGDLLSSHTGQKHSGILLTIAKVFWPKMIINLFFKRFGLFLLISASK